MACIFFRNLCDINQEGKLNPEQFALAMWLIQQKQAGKDPPAALTPDMVPPSMRAKTQIQVPFVSVYSLFLRTFSFSFWLRFQTDMPFSFSFTESDLNNELV
jgi:hypothetical protein